MTSYQFSSYIRVIGDLGVRTGTDKSVLTPESTEPQRRRRDEGGTTGRTVLQFCAKESIGPTIGAS
ncbi:hypothetical protein E4U14_002874 [Claviceps sp. LM454 group G7]|nr:hypothetical protein E4U14_002874 [Claviceps sp. LM454 group G7]